MKVATATFPNGEADWRGKNRSTASDRLSAFNLEAETFANWERGSAFARGALAALLSVCFFHIVLEGQGVTSGLLSETGTLPFWDMLERKLLCSTVSCLKIPTFHVFINSVSSREVTINIFNLL